MQFIYRAGTGNEFAILPANSGDFVSFILVTFLVHFVSFRCFSIFLIVCNDCQKRTILAGSLWPEAVAVNARIRRRDSIDADVFQRIIDFY
jgi:hypothetical protein